MSEISKEALAAACAEKVRQLEFSVQQSAFDSVRHELETELAIARVALLALRERAEPVGYRKLFTCSSCGAEGLDEPLESRCHCNGDGARWIEGRLYTAPYLAAPPAPVVLKIDRKAICNKVHWLCARSPGATFYNAAEFALDELLALREKTRRAVAYLKAVNDRSDPEFKDVLVDYAIRELDGNDHLSAPPVPVADGWIACSERMPEREYVLAADFSGAYYPPSLPNTQVGIYADWFEDGKPSWDDGDGNDLHLKRVTHWMPLPAAPGKEG